MPAVEKLQRAEGMLDLRFAASGGQATILSSVFQCAPCRVLTPVPDPGEPFSAVLITTSGGLTGGDSLNLRIGVGPEGDALCTPQAAEKIYRATEFETTNIDAVLEVTDRARLEWLPQEMILFDGARLRRSITFDLAESAKLLAGDITVFGRIAHGEAFCSGLLFDRWQVRRGGRLVWTDAGRLEHAIGDLLKHPAGFQGAAAQALILCQTPEPERLRDAVREVIASAKIALSGVTLLNGLLLARLLDSDPARLRRSFALLWSVLRPAIGRPATMPRHWRF